jgi:signal transduction histidine kinase
MTRATVALGYHGGFLELGIFDDGHGSAIDVVPGHGLVGMQQRAALLGGEFAAGPGPDGGFRVTARLPTEGRRP